MALAPFGSSVSHLGKLLELLIRTFPLSTLRTPNWIKLTVLLNFVLLIPNIYIEYKQDLISSVYNNKSVITVIFRLFFGLERGVGHQFNSSPVQHALHPCSPSLPINVSNYLDFGESEKQVSGDKKFERDEMM